MVGIPLNKKHSCSELACQSDKYQKILILIADISQNNGAMILENCCSEVSIRGIKTIAPKIPELLKPSLSDY